MLSCLSLHVYNYVKNILKHVLFYIHGIKVMAEEIGLSIKKLPKNILFYPIVGQTKTRKLLLTGLKIKHNVTVLTPHYTILHLKEMVVQHLFKL